MGTATWTGIAPIDFVANSVINLFSLLSAGTGLGYWPTVGITLFVAWPLASAVVYRYLTKNAVNAPGCNA